MKLTSVGIIGYGHFGQFVAQLIERFVPDVPVRVYSRRAELDGKRFFDFETVAQSSVVVLCCGISEYEATVTKLLSYLTPGTVVVDVATVKKHTTELFRRSLPTHQWLCCHPMFGAESYKKTNGDISGYRIVVTDHTLPLVAYESVIDWLRSLGFVVIVMTADEHDKLLADTLFLTHYIGQAMSTAGIVRTAIDTVSFQSLMNAVESVAQDGKLFQDVYHYNPYCEAAAVQFHEAQRLVLDGLLKKRVQ